MSALQSCHGPIMKVKNITVSVTGVGARREPKSRGTEKTSGGEQRPFQAIRAADPSDDVLSLHQHLLASREVWIHCW